MRRSPTAQTVRIGGVALAILLLLAGLDLLGAGASVRARASVHPLLRPLIEDPAPLVDSAQAADSAHRFAAWSFISGAITPDGTARSRASGEDAACAGKRISAGEDSGIEDRFGVWVRTTDNGRALQSLGLLPMERNGSPAEQGGRGDILRSTRWTPEEIRIAAEDPSVISITPAVRCAPALDVSIVDMRADRVQGRHGTPPVYIGLTGTGTVVGVVDSGLDLLHEDFRQGGQTRVYSVWDQTHTNNPPEGFTYGTEWTTADIQAGIATEVDLEGHGTHVTGIAVGNGGATGNGQPAYQFVGVAPRATIVSVKTDFMTDHIVDGVRYVFRAADSLGLPAVVNLSLGTHFGSHDGRDDMSLALAQITGPGHVVVAAAGNEGGSGIHARRMITSTNAIEEMSLNILPFTPNPGIDEIDFDGWYSPIIPLSFSIVTPNGTTVGPVAAGHATDQETPDGTVAIDNTTTGSNGDREVLIALHDNIGAPVVQPGIWTFRIHRGNAAPTDTTYFDVWNFFQSSNLSQDQVFFVLGRDDSDLVLAPASGDSVIAVGAYVTRTSWIAENGSTYASPHHTAFGHIAPFSSPGYRRDGVIKPDLSAPGSAIISAFSSTTQLYDPHRVVQDGVHIALEGTSMASPHIAGLVSLMYQGLGRLGVGAMRFRLNHSARADSRTGVAPNPTWGWAKADAVGATGVDVPVTLVESGARQEADRLVVRFVLSADAGEAPLPVWREDPAMPARRAIGWTSRGTEKVFVDSTLTTEGTYSYWLKAQEENGDPLWIGPVSAQFVARRDLALSTSPNPFTKGTVIRWSAPGGHATLAIYEVGGRRIRVIDCGRETSGTFAWDGAGVGGRPAAAGVYFVLLAGSDGRRAERRIIRLR
jgi:hypothetical protein